MKKTFILSTLLAAGPAQAGPAAAGGLRVVTTTTDLAAVAREIVGADGEVAALAPPNANPHFVEAKPSYIVKLLKADAYVQTGLELEIGWAPLLLQGARRGALNPGSPGHIDASEAIKPIEVPQNPSRIGGDVHPGGNPHYLTDPENARLVARLFAARFAALDPERAGGYQERLKGFESKLDAAETRWGAALAPLRGKRMVSYHREWNYFALRYGLVLSGELEPKPGIPPTARHTAGLIASMKQNGVRLIVTDVWYERRTPQAVASATGAQVALMALCPGADRSPSEYFAWMDDQVARVLEAALPAAGSGGR